MIGELQAHYRTLYDAPDPSPVDPQEFTPPAGRFFAGYLDDSAVAMGGWRWIEALPGIGALRPVEIKRMYVATSARGQGCARRPGTTTYRSSASSRPTSRRCTSVSG